MWFTENSWPPILICVVISGLIFALAGSLKKPSLRKLGLALLLGCPALWLLERVIVTDQERHYAEIQARIHDLASAFQSNDKPGAVAFFSEDVPVLRTTAGTAIDMVNVTDVTVKELTVSPLDEKTLQSQFRANATLSLKLWGGTASTMPTRWRLEWQQRQGKWVIIAVTRLHPIRDEEIPILDRGI